MNEIETLVHAYASFVQLPWTQSLSGAEKIWFAVYEPAQERRLRFRMEEFAEATRQAGHSWTLFDLTNIFAEWMAQQEYHEAYFALPEHMTIALNSFIQHASEQLIQVLTASEVDANTVVAVLGLASLFGLTYGSTTATILNAVAPSVRGRLLVFFPGQRNGPTYRLLDARDGWNYLAVPITGEGGK
jgi:hypothetical protein